MKLYLNIIGLLFLSITIGAQQIDILIKGGHVIDPKNGINELMDVAIENGKIFEVAKNIEETRAFQVVDATGLYVVPGLIDLHSHNFWGTEDNAYLANSYSALPPDGFTFRSGITTIVDVGGAGWRNFNTFKKQTIEHSRTRVLSFLNIVGSGMAGGAIEQNLADMDSKLTAMAARSNPDHVVGVKVAHYSGPEWEPVEKAVEAGKLAKIPVMVDFGGKEPPHDLEVLFMEKLRPGDIFTHAYAHVKGRMPVVDEQRKLRPFVLKAQERGIIFDVGHGGGSFLFDQAIPAIEQGLKPNTISTDLHTGSMNGGMKDLNNVMSKFLNMGLSMNEVIKATTMAPAEVISRDDIGHLSIGIGADVAMLKLEEGNFGFVDTKGWRYDGTQKLICEMTIRDGVVVWDLNGLSRPKWEK